MKHLPLTAWPRQTGHKGAIHEDRARGYVPGILLGHHEPALTFKVLAGDLTRVLRKGGQNALVEIDLEGNTTLAIVREFVRDPRSRKIVHLDLQRVSADEAIDAEIPIVIHGKPEGLQMGGVLMQEINAIHVKGIADELPSHIDVDVSHLSVGHGLHVRELTVPAGITVLTPPEQLVALVAVKHGKEIEEEQEEALETESEPAASTETE